MKKRLLIILFVLILYLVCLIPVAGADIIGGVTAPETTATILPTVTEPTAEPTTIHTTIRTTEPTTVPTSVPTTVVTTEPTITITEPTRIGGQTGYFDIYVNVNGATVKVNGNVEGTTPPNPVVAEVYSTGAPATITVSAPGYITWQNTPGNPPANQHVAINANLVPIVTTAPTVPPVSNGAIYVQSYPAGAAIYMNGVLQGNAPMTIPNLPPNSYAMRASLSGHTTDNTVINVYAGQTAYYSPTLQPSPSRNTGTVYVTSDPGYASVYVDGAGNYYGKTPVTLTLYPGSHTILLKLSGYNDYSTSVQVNANQAQNLPVSLTPAVFGSVIITSLPGASVYMDSILKGNIGPDGSLTLQNIPSGNHIFKVSASGYNDWINTVYIQPSYQNRITASLTPVGPGPAPYQPAGGLNIASSPPGAEMFVDNLYRGYTPATITDLSPGQHSVMLKYTGYVDYMTTVTVNSGQTTPLAVTMSPAPTPTPKSAPSLPVMIGGLCAIIGTVMVLRRR